MRKLIKESVNQQVVNKCEDYFDNKEVKSKNINCLGVLYTDVQFIVNSIHIVPLKAGFNCYASFTWVAGTANVKDQEPYPASDWIALVICQQYIRHMCSKYFNIQISQFIEPILRMKQPEMVSESKNRVLTNEKIEKVKKYFNNRLVKMPLVKNSYGTFRNIEFTFDEIQFEESTQGRIYCIPIVRYYKGEMKVGEEFYSFSGIFFASKIIESYLSPLLRKYCGVDVFKFKACVIKNSINEDKESIYRNAELLRNYLLKTKKIECGTSEYPYDLIFQDVEVRFDYQTGGVSKFPDLAGKNIIKYKLEFFVDQNVYETLKQQNPGRKSIIVRSESFDRVGKYFNVKVGLFADVTPIEDKEVINEDTKDKVWDLYIKKRTGEKMMLHDNCMNYDMYNWNEKDNVRILFTILEMNRLISNNIEIKIKVDKIELDWERGWGPVYSVPPRLVCTIVERYLKMDAKKYFSLQPNIISTKLVEYDWDEWDDSGYEYRYTNYNS